MMPDLSEQKNRVHIEPAGLGAEERQTTDRLIAELYAVLKDLERAGGIWPDLHPRVLAVLAKVEGR